VGRLIVGGKVLSRREDVVRSGSRVLVLMRMVEDEEEEGNGVGGVGEEGSLKEGVVEGTRQEKIVEWEEEEGGRSEIDSPWWVAVVFQGKTVRILSDAGWTVTRLIRRVGAVVGRSADRIRVLCNGVWLVSSDETLEASGLLRRARPGQGIKMMVLLNEKEHRKVAVNQDASEWIEELSALEREVQVWTKRARHRLADPVDLTVHVGAMHDDWERLRGNLELVREELQTREKYSDIKIEEALRRLHMIRNHLDQLRARNR